MEEVLRRIFKIYYDKEFLSKELENFYVKETEERIVLVGAIFCNS